MMPGIELNLQGWLARISDEGIGRLAFYRFVPLDTVICITAAETS